MRKKKNLTGEEWECPYYKSNISTSKDNNVTTSYRHAVSF